MRNLNKVPIFINKHTSFEVKDVPIFELFYDLIQFLKTHSCKISETKYKIQIYMIDFIYSCHFTLEIFESDSSHLFVELSFKNGKKELFFQTFNKLRNQSQSNACLYIFPPNKDLFLKGCNEFKEYYNKQDLLIQMFELIVLNTNIEILSKNATCNFNLAVTIMLQSNEIDILRMGIFLIKNYILNLKELFQNNVSEWISLLYVQYQLLPINIFTRDILKDIVLICEKK